MPEPSWADTMVEHVLLATCFGLTAGHCGRAAMANQPATQQEVSTGSASSSRTDVTYETDLLFDTENGVTISPPKRQRIVVTAALARVFVRASRTIESQEPPLSFSSLLVAMLMDEDEWLKAHFERSGVRLATIESHKPYGHVRPQAGDEGELENEYGTTVSAHAALDEAMRVARRSTGRATVDMRHLCAAYPVLPDWHIEDFENFNIDRLKWARVFGAEMASRFPKERRYWSSYANSASPVPLTSFSADVYTEEDLLGIDRGVDALALVVASTRTVTPLAIGVFGPWGSGKSFFMRHLQRRIVRIRRDEQARIGAWKDKRAAQTAQIPDAPLYFGEIAQVEFNAWHYNEGNLVASLVEHLFRNLRVLPNEGDAQLAKRRDAMLRQLNGLKSGLSTIDKTITDAEQKVAAANTSVQEAAQAAEHARKDVQAKASEMAAHHTALDAQRQRLEKALQEAELAPDEVKVDAVIAVALGPLAPLVNEVRTTITALREKTFDWKLFLERMFSVKGLVVLALCVASPWILWIAKYLEGQWAVFVGSVTAALAGFASALDVLKRHRLEFETKLAQLEVEQRSRVDEARKKLAEEHTKQIEASQSRVGALKSELDAQGRLLADREAKLVQAAQELAACAGEHDAKLAERVQAEDKVRIAQAELNRLSSALLLEEFIKDRSSTDEYRKQLGFLALVRRDIERLSELIDQANQRWLEPRNKDPEPLLNRIVLYIDDLDRCKETTVLAVLEAVHLLLAFPLFVCAVAVDPRWVEKCLRQARRQLFSDGESSALDGHDAGGTQGVCAGPRTLPTSRGDGEANAPATVGDYLEKIFQIPIWMSPIEARARANLVNSLLGPTASPSLRQFRSAQDAAEPEPVARERTQPDAFVTLVQKARETPDPLLVAPEEVAFIDEISELLSERPRALKRLVNIYRLLKASLPDIERATFVSSAPSCGYRVCLTQLAIFTSHPRLAPSLLAALGGAADANHEQQAGSDGPPASLTLQQWFDQLDMPRDPLLVQVIEVIPNCGSLRVDEFRRWLPETSRYLFNRNR
jgi:KAP family P-loop domain